MSEVPVIRVEVVLTADSALLDALRALAGAQRPAAAKSGNGLWLKPESPAQDGVAAAPREPRRLVWTDERNALLREGYPAGVPVPDLLARLETLPGAPVAGDKAVMAQARYLGLPPRRRAAWCVWNAERDTLLRDRWPAGDTPEQLLAAASALPGEPIATLGALIQRVKKLGLRRAPAVRHAIQERLAQTMREALAAKIAPAVESRTPNPSFSEEKKAKNLSPASPVVKQSLTAAPSPAAAQPAPAARAAAERVAANLAPLSIPSRPSYDWAGEYLRDGRVLCDAARVAAYCARYDVRPAGDMIAVNTHRASRAWPPMSLCEPALLPAGAAYPVPA